MTAVVIKHPWMATLQQVVLLHIFRHFSPHRSVLGIAAKFRILSTVAQISQPKRARTVRNQYSILERGVQMKKLFLGSVALVAMLGGPAAFAADMPLRAPAPVVVATW